MSSVLVLDLKPRLRRATAYAVMLSYSSLSLAQVCPGDPRCLNNPYGAGNPYKPDGLMNPNSQYGSKYSNQSWTNPYATDAPKIYDQQGNYRGRLSTNPSDSDSVSNPHGRYGNPNSPESINNPYGAGNFANTNHVVRGGKPAPVVQPATDIDFPVPHFTPAQAGGAILALLGVAVIATVVKGIINAVENNSNAIKYSRETAKKTPEELRKVGEFYLYGPADKQDHDLGREYLLSSAAQGDVQAKLNLGVVYQTGRGVSRDASSAFKWFKEAADNGNAQAQLIVADYFATGTVASQSFESAYLYYVKSASQGNARAQAMAGAYLRSGIGTPQDIQQAKILLERSVIQNEPWGKFYLAEWLLSNPNTDISQQTRARELLTDLEQTNIFLAKYLLGSIYEPGVGIEKNLDLALKYFLEAAEFNVGQSMLRVAYFYENGHAVDKNIQEAIRWYEKADKFGVPGAHMKVKILKRL